MKGKWCASAAISTFNVKEFENTSKDKFGAGYN
jgi:hypothetical protein